MLKYRLLAGMFFFALFILPMTVSGQETLKPGETLLGNIAAEGDSVEYVLNTQQSIIVEIIPVAASLAPQFAILSEDTSLGVWYSVNAGDPLVIPVDIPQSGEYRIRVSAGKAGAATGAFSITVRTVESAPPTQTLPIPEPESTEASTPPQPPIPVPSTPASVPVPAIPTSTNCSISALRGTVEGSAVLATPIGRARITSAEATSGLLKITGVQTGEPICDGTQASLLLLESGNGEPQRVEVDGALIEFTSAIAIRANRDTDAFANSATNNPQVLHLIVLDGTASISGHLVAAGFTIMSAADPQTGERLRWVGERPLNDEELALLEQLVSIDVPLPR